MLPSISQLAYGALALSSAVQAAITLDINDPNSIKSAAGTAAFDMMTLYTGNQSGQTPGVLPGGGQPNGYYWWEGGGMFGGLIHYWYYTGDTTYNDVVTQGMLFQVGDGQNYEPRNQSFDLGNDDQAFWAMAAMSAAEVKFPNPPANQPQWLALAQAVFNRQQPRYDNATCGGGLRWQANQFNQGYDYKNAIANGCFTNLAARLGKYTGNQTYIQWAETTYNWVKQIGLIDPNYNIWDGSSVEQNCSSFNHDQWTYNTGVFLYAAAVLWNVTGSDMWKQEVQGMINGVKIFTPNGGQVMSEVICEPAGNCNVDSQSYKAYLARWIADTIKVAPWTRDQLFPILQKSAQAAASTCSGGSTGNFCGLSWVKQGFNVGAPDFTGHPAGIGEQLSAMEVIQVNLLDSVPGPVDHNGGISNGDVGAGNSNSNAKDGGSGNSALINPITTGDKAGASILTILVIVCTLGSAAWMLI